uniref:Tankyrase 1-binding protein C-terminal domain-containing protein n=1 Tax=Gopherus agassizii TaxID=38772 RepID=A0A452IH42_9SAUR
MDNDSDLPFFSQFSLAWTCPIPVAPAELSLGAAPGTSAGLAQAPGSPILPAEHPVSAPGSPAVPVELPALGSTPTHTELPSKVGPCFPGTPESLAKIPIGLLPAPGAPDAPAEPCCRISLSLGSLEVPGEGSPPPSSLPEGLAPGTPDASTELPHSLTAVRALSPGPPDAPARLSPSPPAEQPLVPGPTDAPVRLPHSPPAGQAMAPDSPDTPARFPHSPTEEWALAPGAHDAPTELTHSPPAGQALAPGPPDVPPELPARITHSPGAPEVPVPSPETPNLCPELPTKVSRSPGSPDGAPESLVSPCSPPSPERGSPSPLSDAEPCAGPAPADESLRCPQLGLRRSSDGVVQLPDKGLGMGVLGGSLAALPRGGPPHSGPPLEGESNWALSQSFEWAFPSRTAEWEPPRSPIREADDSGLSEQGDSDGEGLASTPKGSEERSSSERLDWQDAKAAESSAHLDGATGAPCDQGATEVGGLEATCLGGPVAETEPAVAELKGPAVVDEAGTIWEEQGRPLLGAPLRPTEPKLGQERAAPILLSDTPRPAGADRCQEDNLMLGLAPVRSCQEGPRPGEEGSEPHPNARWLDELLASPPPSADETKRKGTPEPSDPAGPEDLLGWSRKDLCSEFGIRGAHRAGEFGWATEPGTGKTDWPGSYRASETEQDREFGTGTQDWSSTYKETELLGDSSVGHGNWPDAYGIGDSCRKEGEFSPGKPDWSSQYNTGGADSQGGEFSTRKLDWTSTYGIGDGAQQDNRFSTSKPDWTPEYSVGNTPGVSDAALQDREFGTGKPDWTHEHNVGDTDQQDREFGTGKPDWTRQPGVGDTAWQDREFSTSEPDWTYDRGGDTDQADREFGTSRPDWINMYGADTDQQDRELGTRKPGWTLKHGVGDTDQKDRELGTSKLDWTREYGISDTDHQGKEFGAGKPAWTQDCSVKTNGQSREWTCEYGVDFDSTAQEPGARKPGWSGTDWQESKFPFARRDCASDFRIRGAEHESQFGVIGTERAGGFGLSTLDPSGAVGTLGPAELGERRTDWAGYTRTVNVDEPREAGVGQSDWTQELGLSGTDPSVSLGAISPEEPSGGWMDWTNELRVSSMDPSSSRALRGSDTSREPGVGQLDGSVGQAETRVRQTDWSRELGSGDEGSTETREAGAGQMDWASEVGIVHEKQTYATAMAGLELHGDSRGRGVGLHGPGGSMDQGGQGLTALSPSSGSDSPRLSSPSSLLEEVLVKAAAQRKSTGEERGPPPAPNAHTPPSPQEEDGGSRPEGDGAPSPSDAMDGGWLPTEARRPPWAFLSRLGTDRCLPPSPGHVQDMEVLDSAIYRSRANLGRKRGHRAPAMRPAGSLGLSEVDAADWMFRDSTEPRTVRWASSDEEVAEEPQSRRARPSPAAKGMKVPLFPGLNPSALKAKPTTSKEPHVQRSKSCKIPGVGGKPLVLPPKPEKSSGSDAASPHWLQVLKLKKKKS